MTAQPNKQSKQQPVNPVLLVILGIVAIGCGGYYVFTNYIQPPSGAIQPLPTPSVLKNNGTVAVTQINGINQLNSSIDKNVSPSPENNTLFQNDTNTNRDPFEPSKLYIQNKNNQTNVNAPVASTVPDAVKLIPVQSSIPLATPTLTPTPSPKEEIVWEGVVSSKNDQLVLIKYKDKSLSMRLGDRLPGTSYILAQINKDYVVLLSPKDKLQLNRKKEAKK